MDIKQLTYFVAVFEHANLSHAASHLAVAQSAISHHIGKLEAELGTPLFVRKPRGMEPTAAGQRLFSHARHILASIRNAEQDMLHNAEEIAGEFAIGLPFSVMKGISVPLMRRVLSDFPKVRLSIVEGLSGSTHNALLASDVDMALFYNPNRNPEITIVPVLEEDILCVGRTSIISDSRGPITFAELSELPVLLLRHGASARALIDRPGLLSRLEANAPLQLNSISGITNGMLAGLGCTIAPQVFVRDHLDTGALHARSIIEPQLTRRLYLGYRRDYPSNRLFEAIRTLVLDLIEQEVRSNAWVAEYCYRGS
ncbi:LysR family transcriptional regulator [Cohaesibacter celericrescens]|uniref:Transcriptional regulator n=1 Tax=Cohaesibacter celericrescens TaxID=2067669 RepID=A0A2N5XXN1_9HYPH|nr:LysR family transcriptional regulator [Cohaesibacter celericrescens]PLW79205.1 transcriptional regulator [Cohaesibacter celericrescens]